MLKPYLHNSNIYIISEVKNLLEISDIKPIEQLSCIRPDIVCMFMAYPNIRRLNIQMYCLEQGIPCIGIEEGHQATLNNGRVNHYFTPMDALSVPTHFEREKLTKIGMYCDKISVNGWCFFDDYEIHNDTISTENKIILFLSPLTIIDCVSDETIEKRRSILKTTKHFISTTGYSCLIKLHPMESKDLNLQKMLSELNMRNVLIAKNQLNISQLMQNAAFIFNRGNSQIVIEALKLDKKIVILDKTCSIYPSILKFDKNTSPEEFIRRTKKKEYHRAIDQFKQIHLPDETGCTLERIGNFILYSNTTSRDTQKFATHLLLLYFILTCQLLEEALKHITDTNYKNSIVTFLKVPRSYRHYSAAVIQHKEIYPDDNLCIWYLGKIHLKYNYLSYFRSISLAPDNVVPFFWNNKKNLNDLLRQIFKDIIKIVQVIKKI